MTEEDVIRRLFAAFADRDVEAALAVVDPALEFWPGGTSARTGRAEAYRGHEGIRQYFDDVALTWASLAVDPSDLRAVGGGVVAFGTVRGRSFDAPAEMQAPVFWVFRLRDCRVVYARVTPTAAEALADASTAAGAS